MERVIVRVLDYLIGIAVLVGSALILYHSWNLIK